MGNSARMLCDRVLFSVHGSHSAAALAGNVRHRRWRRPCCIGRCACLGLIWILLFLSGCGYLRGRAEDFGDIFYFSAGPALGLDAEAFISPIDISLGGHRANVYGWEGRQWIHRHEGAGGLPILCLLFQETAHSKRFFSLSGESVARSEIVNVYSLPKEPAPYVAHRFCAGFGFLPVDFMPARCTPRDEYLSDVFLARNYPASWGIGIAATPGLVNVRAGVGPFAIVNFATGWFGFHLLPPYKFFASTLDYGYARNRGFLTRQAQADPVSYILADLRDNDPLIRVYSLKMLASLNDSAKEYVPQMESLVQDPDLWVQTHAIVALWRVDPHRYPAEPALLKRAGAAKRYQPSWPYPIGDPVSRALEAVRYATERVK